MLRRRLITLMANQLRYLLRDEFGDDRAAGSVNGTPADPGPGTRTVVDTESKLSITGGVLTFAGGKAMPAWGDPGVWYPVVTRKAGVLLLATLVQSATNTYAAKTGFHSSASGNPTIHALYLGNTADIGASDGSATFANLGVYTQSTPYSVAVVLRASGAYYLIRGGAYTKWTLIFATTFESTASLYPCCVNYNAVFTADNLRIPDKLWLPTPLAYDKFTRANGALGNTEPAGPDGQTTPARSWTGATWTVSGNAAINTPVGGEEKVTNGTFTTDLTGWTVGDSGSDGTWTVDAGVAKLTPGVTNTSANDGISQGGVAVLAHTWYRLSGRFAKSADYTSNEAFLYSGAQGAKYLLSNATLTASLAAFAVTFRSSASENMTMYLRPKIGAASTLSADDVSVKPLVLSELFSSLQGDTPNIIADVNITRTAGTQSGIVTNLDSASNPANFVLAYMDGAGNCKVDECVGGSYTNKISAAVTYSAGATLRVVRDGTYCAVYYNNALVGSSTSMTANTNTLHGLFSTYSGNSLDSFVLWPRGNGGEYAALDQF